MSATILSRLSDLPSSSSISPTSIQDQVDETVFSTLKKQLTDPYLIAAQLVGVGVYSLVRIPTLRYAQPAVITRYSEHLTVIALRSPEKIAWLTLASYFGSALAGAAACEFSQRGFLQLGGKGAEYPNLWKWEGDGGLGQGLRRSVSTFAGGLLIGDAVGRGILQKGYSRSVSIVGGSAAGLTYFEGSRLFWKRVLLSPKKERTEPETGLNH
jgi:hypothetical protein